ncbi:hypothetical protein HAZT_HAZT001642 [Hyalella azteca]|uniref:N-myc downstream regulated n=1 Tax=Hyalella azteca TaxID=294128 RepID=A0A6A0GUR8_HYAAZ|nr:hypothetical protein HAZT_HAZT001642 [Hyalella azteca]
MWASLLQGDLTKIDQRAVFLTVHDLGCNHNAWVQFLEHPVMKETRERSIFIHVVVPGQDDNAEDLPSEMTFPTMQQISEDLPGVLDKLEVKLVIGLGEGAGANILARFAMAAPDRCMGLILIHCTASSAGVMEHFKDKASFFSKRNVFISWKLSSGVPSSAEQYLIIHKFGNPPSILFLLLPTSSALSLNNLFPSRPSHIACPLQRLVEVRSLVSLLQQLESAENKESLIKEFQDRLQSKINPRNLRKYVEAFLKRSDFSSKLESKLGVETLLVTGSKASHVNAVHTMHQACNKTKASLLKIDDVGDVLSETVSSLMLPDKFAQSLLLFCKGLGVLTSVPLTGVDRPRMGSASGKGGLVRQRTMSMEEYDTPNLRRFSFSSITPAN